MKKDLKALNSIYKRSKGLVVNTIVWFLISVVLGFVLIKFANDYPYDPIYGNDNFDFIDPSYYEQTISSSEHILYIFLMIFLAYSLVSILASLIVAIVILVNACKLSNNIPNKTMFVTLSILGFFILFIISYICLWVMAKNEKKSLEKQSEGGYQKPYDRYRDDRPYDSYRPSNDRYDYPPRRRDYDYPPRRDSYYEDDYRRGWDF